MDSQKILSDTGTSKIFRTKFAEDIFNHKYRHEGCESWELLADVLVEDVCRDKMSKSKKEQLKKIIKEMKFIPAGRYLYYAGRQFKAFNNCYLLRCEEDSREDWANLSWKAESCLMTGGGIGSDYSMYRAKNSVINRTGGLASGPLSKMRMINEIGREVMQGGSRRSAIYASLNWKHQDILEFIHSKDWYSMKIAGTDFTIGDMKEKDFNYPAPLDMTNISVNYDTEWLENYHKTGNPGNIFYDNVKQALKTSEPGFSFNFYEKEKETLRNACVSGDTEVLTKDGYKYIDSLVGQEVEIWNGFEWSKVVPKITGNNQHVIKVTLSDNRQLISTDYHKWYLAEGYTGKSREVTTNSLKIGDKIIKYKFPILIEGEQVSPKHAYTQGFISAEGMDDYKFFWLYEPKYMCKDRLDIRLEGPEFKNVNGVGRQTIYYTDIYNDKNYVPFEWDLTSKLEWLSGLFDGDGTELLEGGMQLCSTNISFLSDLQKLLSTLGVNSKIVNGNEEGNRMLPDGKGGLKEYFCNTTYRICVGAVQIQELVELGLVCNRLKFQKAPQRDASQFVKVVKIEDGGYLENVYCFNEPLRHYGVFNGILTGQCTEVTSEDDSDVCNLGSINMANIESKEEFKEIVELGTEFLMCGTLVADLPYEKVERVRDKNRRLGLGLMGIHEWLLKKNYKYEVTPELHEWLAIYKNNSSYTSRIFADKLGISRPVANRAIAPTGTIGILAGTSTGIEPLFAVAYKRRYLKNRSNWMYQYVIDGTAKIMIDQLGIDPDKIESAVDLASDPERRIKFQADIQDYVDMSISSTINLPSWGSDLNNEGTVVPFANLLAKYSHRLRGFTCYADGSRGGQPITPVSYNEAKKSEGQEFTEEFNDICSISGKGGHCGV